jgi:site-specific DNA-methyltransferase (adenine-specific)
LGEGVIADAFMGSGSTIAACEALNLQGIGIERYPEYFDLAKQAIPRLKALESEADEVLSLGRLF